MSVRNKNPQWRSTVICLIAAAMFPLWIGCNAAARFNNIQGRQAFEFGQYNEAINRFQRALYNNPQNADAYYNLASTYHHVGKQTRNQQLVGYAEQLYRQSISMDARFSDAHRGLAVLLAESGRTDAAFDLVRTWQARNPYSAEPMVELARLYQEFGDRNQASQYLTDALVLDANNPRALTALGAIREQEGQLKLALENYMRAYQANANQPGVAAKIAQLQTQLQYAGTPLAPQTRWGSANQYVPR